MKKKVNRRLRERDFQGSGRSVNKLTQFLGKGGMPFKLRQFSQAGY